MKIVNKPVFIPVADYDVAIEKYIERLKKNEGVISVNTMGSIQAPGLSDIDIIVVVRDDFYFKKSVELSVRGVDDRLFIHGPVIIPSCMASVLQYIIYAKNINNLYGENCLQKIDEVDRKIFRQLQICYLIDFIESRFLQFADTEYSGMVDQRVWMTRLWSIIHSYRMYSEIGIDLSDKDIDCINTIKTLRNSWNESSEINDNEFICAFKTVKKSNSQIFKEVLDYIYGPEVSFCLKKKYISKLNKKIYFDGDIDLPVCRVKKLIFLIRRIRAYGLTVPLNYAIHLSGYGFLNVPVHDSSLEEHFQTMKKRRQIVENHLRWVEKFTPFSGSMNGYLGLSPYQQSGWKAYFNRQIFKMILR